MEVPQPRTLGGTAQGLLHLGDANCPAAPSPTVPCSGFQEARGRVPNSHPLWAWVLQRRGCSRAPRLPRQRETEAQRQAEDVK